MIGINSWVRPTSGSDSEIIVGRITHVPPDPSEVRVTWLSNERGLWDNYEAVNDLIEIPVPEILLIEALMVSIQPDLIERRVQT